MGDDEALLHDANSRYSEPQLRVIPKIRLTERQKQYIWLMGSFPDKIAVQGRGYRTSRLMYGLTAEELVIFGYSTPLLWLTNRGLTRQLQNADAYVLTDDGTLAFQQILISGAGLTINKHIRKVTVAA